MDLYSVYSLEDRKKIDKFFLETINNYNLGNYNRLLCEMNNTYNDKQRWIINVKDNKFEEDIDSYFKLKYVKKYKNNIDEIFYEPITLEMLNNLKYYNKYIKQIVNLSVIDCFGKILETYKNKDKFNKLIDNALKNYKNEYYKGLMILYFNKIIKYNIRISDKQLNQIIEFFINEEANAKNLKIEFKITKLSSLIKKLLSFETMFNEELKQLEIKLKQENNMSNLFFYNIFNFILDKKIVLRKINEYKKISAGHIRRDFLSDSLIEINISNFKKNFFYQNKFFSKLLEAIYHELRHAYQSSGQDIYLKFNHDRDDLILKYNYEKYLENHRFIPTEIDANLYGFRSKNIVLDENFNINIDKTNNEKIEMLILLNRYQKKLELDKLTDEIVFENPKVVKEKAALKYEYLNSGYPKPLIMILIKREKTKNQLEKEIYDEIIIRWLNRFDKEKINEMLDNIFCNFKEYVYIIEEVLKNEIDKIKYILARINDDNQEFYQSKIKEYIDFINYYYLQILNIKEQNRLAKKYTK